MFKEEDMMISNGVSATMTIKDWIKYSLLSLLSLVPFVGSITYLIICLMLICSKETNKSLRNYMLANLIISGIALVLCIVLIIGLINTLNTPKLDGVELLNRYYA